jgi:hypothetical protein
MYARQYDFDTMMLHTDGYLAVIDEIPGTKFIEQKLDTGIDTCYGTADCVVVGTDRITVVDLKYGQGVAVDAVENPQLMLYACGAIDKYGDLLGAEMAEMIIYQPRLNSVSRYELPVAELIAWRDRISEIAIQALGPDAPFGPSESACRWCLAKGICRAQKEEAIKRDFGPISELLTPDEIAEALAAAPMIDQWLKDLRSAALDMAYAQGKQIPGYKVVLSGGRRIISDSDAAIETLTAAGYKQSDVSVRLVKGIGDLDKIVGPSLADVLGPLLVKSVGKPALVPESDKRPAVNPDGEASREFG